MQHTPPSMPNNPVTRGFFVSALLMGLVTSALASKYELDEIHELASDVRASVVKIEVAHMTPTRQSPRRGQLREGLRDLFEDLERDFGFRFRLPEEGTTDTDEEDVQSETRFSGSGVIIDEAGYVLTNAHVVNDASRVVVWLNDRRTLEGEVVGIDEATDVALVRLLNPPSNLHAADVGSSDAMRPGQWVIAVGSPFDLEQTVTAGILSAKGRSVPIVSGGQSYAYVPFLQSDVAVNPGNSGGPLFNLDGEVIGINAVIYSVTGTFSGISFAIPVDLAMDIAAQLRESGVVARAQLGVYYQSLNYAISQSLGMDNTRGALVTSVIEGSAADDAGIEAGDVIAAVDGKNVQTANALAHIVGRKRPGDRLPVLIIRARDGEVDTVRKVITLGAALTSREAPTRPQNVQKEPDVVHGLRLVPNDDERGGVRITGKVRGSRWAARLGLQSDDVITHINNVPVRITDDVEALLDDTNEGDFLSMRVLRGDGVQILGFQRPKW